MVVERALVYEETTLNVDNEKIIAELFELRKDKSLWADYSNSKTAEQIHPYFDNEEPKVPNFKEKFGALDELKSKVIDVLANKYTFNNIYVWYNINVPGSYNRSHHHVDPYNPEPKTSGVYYISAPENSGDLVFTESNERYEPSAGRLIYFHPTTWHAVDVNFSDENRISMAFNLYND